MIIGMDSYFHIGQSHVSTGKPCQDYALAGMWEDGIAFATVSDGCSTGGHTDIGARIVTLSTLEAMHRYGLEGYGAEWTSRVNERRRVLIEQGRALYALSGKTMSATSIYAIYRDGNGIINLTGDGVVAFKFSDGRIQLSRFEWDDNTPYYPAYSPADTEEFVKKHGGDLDRERLHRTDLTLFPDGTCSEEVSIAYPLRQGLMGIDIPIPNDVENALHYAALFTDGVTQVDAVDWKIAVTEFLLFKTAEGEFAKRRMIAGIRAAQKTGRGPIDDIGYAVLRFGSADPEGVET